MSAAPSTLATEWKAPPAPAEQPAVEAREVYFDPHGEKFWQQNPDGNWKPWSLGGMKLLLRSDGLSQARDGGLSPLERCLVHIMRNRAIDYAGPLAGHPAGAMEILGRRVLVTSSPAPTVAAKGEWPVLGQLLDNLFGNQLPYFLGWLKTARAQVLSRALMPGQILALAGPPGCGKTLIRTEVIAPLLGGRVAKPYQYMTGKTPFNSELFGAELLAIDDEAASTAHVARVKLAQESKGMLFSQDQRCHRKGREALALTPLWRLVICTNEEPENLSVLPLLDDSMSDKVMLLRAEKRPLPMPTQTSAEQAAFRATLGRELPALAHYLDNEWSIPEELRSERCGVIHYRHPELVAALDVLAPETRLLDLVDGCLFGGALQGDWEGTAEELESALTSSPGYAHAARGLLSWHNACGTYLGKLAKQHPERVSQDRSAKRRGWVIKAPSS